MPNEDEKERALKFITRFDFNIQSVGPFRLQDWRKAPMLPGLYEIGLGSGTSFRPRYIGKAIRQTLQVRLSQHCRKSSNEEIRNRISRNDTLYFRCRAVDFEKETVSVINSIEGAYLIGFSDDYIWNKRQEWSQHWQAEDLS